MSRAPPPRATPYKHKYSPRLIVACWRSTPHTPRAKYFLNRNWFMSCASPARQTLVSLKHIYICSILYVVDWTNIAQTKCYSNVHLRIPRTTSEDSRVGSNSAIFAVLGSPRAFYPNRHHLLFLSSRATHICFACRVMCVCVCVDGAHAVRRALLAIYMHFNCTSYYTVCVIFLV